jgi:hypothetical protein
MISKSINMKNVLKKILVWVISCAGIGLVSASDLQLAKDGTTGYCIVKPRIMSPVDEYAINILARYLKEITGAVFPVVEPAGVTEQNDCIFVGLCEQACSALGTDPLSGFDEEEHVAKVIANDIYLYGNGIHGNLWAIMDFLENSLGWRWFSAYEEPVIPSIPMLVLKPFNRQRNFSFSKRETELRVNVDFYYQNCINNGYERRIKVSDTPYQSSYPRTKLVHTLFAYIPPTPDTREANSFEWQDKKDYFKTNPDFFTLNEAGERVANKQLCFSNPALREELTRNVIKDIIHAQ